MLLKKMVKSLFIIILLLSMIVSSTKPAQAGFGDEGTCSPSYSVTKISFENDYLESKGVISISVTNLEQGQKYFLAIPDVAGALLATTKNQTYTGSTLRFDLDVPSIINKQVNNAKVILMKDTAGVGGFNENICTVGTVNITEDTVLSCEFRVSQQRNGQQCDVLSDPSTCVSGKYPLLIEVIAKDSSGKTIEGQLDAEIRQGFCATANCWKPVQSVSSGVNNFQFNTGDFPKGSGDFEIRVSKDTWGGNYLNCPAVSYNLVDGDCTDSSGQPICKELGDIKTPSSTTSTSADPFNICAQITSGTLRAKCQTCAGGEYGREGVWTAVGCIKRDPKSIIQSLMQIGLGMGGGVALLSTLAGGFILSTSQGNPQKADQAKEIITNSVIGLLFIIFSVVILQFIGVTIFNIPGFGTV